MSCAPYRPNAEVTPGILAGFGAGFTDRETSCDDHDDIWERQRT